MYQIIVLTLDVFGTLMIAFAAIMVHHRVLNEHKIDDRVLFDMRREQLVAIFGVFLIVAAYIMEMRLLI